MKVRTIGVSAVLALVTACSPESGIWIDGPQELERSVGDEEQILTFTTSQGSFIKYAHASAIADVDGDGYGDLFLGAPTYEDGSGNSDGAVYAYYGTATGVDDSVEDILSPDQEVGFELTRFGTEIESVGDLNSDGYDDLMIAGNWAGGDGSSTYGEGGVFVYWGGASGISSSDQFLTSTDGEAEGLFGTQIAHGDFDGDGDTDIAVSQSGSAYGDAFGAIYAYYGVTTSVDTGTEQKIELSSLDTGDVSGNFVEVGDFDNDGYDDMAVSAGDRLHIFYGSASGLDETSEQQITPSGNKRIDSLAIGDFNGDGYADMATSERLVEDANGNRVGEVYWYPGSASGLDASSEFVINNYTGGSRNFFAFRTHAADLDGDGYDDLMLSVLGIDRDTSPEVGAVYVHRGGSGGIQSTYTTEIYPSDFASLDTSWFGTSLSTGDIDGDNGADLVVGAKQADAGYLYLGACGDADGDLVCDNDEDVNGDGDLTNDDSDGDLTPDYLDTDDDGDGILTIGEDADGDGDPTNDDSDGDNTPDYLDNDGAGGYTAPIADAGDNQTVNLGDVVGLDGSGSVDYDGESITHRWKFLKVPTGSAIWSNDMSDRDAVSPTFTPDVTGVYYASLLVNDGTTTDRDNVKITVGSTGNLAPTVDVSNTLTASDVAAQLDLDCTASSDPDGDTLTYRWKIVAAPASSALTSNDIADRNSGLTSITPDVAGNWYFSCRVDDGEFDDEETFKVKVFDFVDMVADAGSDTTVELGNDFTLDASATTGTPTSYRWKLLALPSASGLNANDIADRNAAETTFTPDVAGNFYFTVTVTRGAETDSDTVKHKATEVAAFARPMGRLERGHSDARVVSMRFEDSVLGEVADTGLLDIFGTFGHDDRIALEEGLALVHDVDGDGTLDTLVYALTDETTVEMELYLGQEPGDLETVDHTVWAELAERDEGIHALFLGVHPADLWLFEGLD